MLLVPNTYRPLYLFQYPLPCGSASRDLLINLQHYISILTPSRECIHYRPWQNRSPYFNTHSLAGVLRRYNDRASGSNRISIPTPLRECFLIDRLHWQKCYFNTHSLAGVHRRRCCPLRSRFISILTPSREYITIMSFIFRRLNFNTHSLAGVHLHN